MLGPRNFCHCIHIEEMQGQSQQHNYKLPKTAALAMRREEFFKLKVEGAPITNLRSTPYIRGRKANFPPVFSIHSTLLFFPFQAMHEANALTKRIVKYVACVTFLAIVFTATR